MWHGPCLNKQTSTSLKLVKDIVRILEHLGRDERRFHFLKQNLSLDTRQHNCHLLCYMYGGNVNSQCNPYSPWKELELEGLHLINFCRRSNDFCRFPISLMKPSKINPLLGTYRIVDLRIRPSVQIQDTQWEFAPSEKWINFNRENLAFSNKSIQNDIWDSYLKIEVKIQKRHRDEGSNQFL